MDSKFGRIYSPVARSQCGVGGVISNQWRNVAQNLYAILFSQFTRGQEGAGIVVHDSYYEIEREHKGIGKVRDVFQGFDFRTFSGQSGIGHNRYGTIDKTNGKNQEELLQPLKVDGAEFFISHNGTIPPHALKKLEKYSNEFISDTQALAFAMKEEREKGNSWVEVMRKLEDEVLDGSYSCAMLDGPDLIAFRDPRGLKPLVIGELEDGYAVASETSALEFALHAKKIRTIRPGEIVIIDSDGLHPDEFAKPQVHAHCAFEYDYFGNPTSDFEGVNLRGVRINLGKILARRYPVKNADSVGSVPDSGRGGAEGFSKKSGLPLEEYLQSNRDVGRIFITPGADEREKARVLKYFPHKKPIDGKIIVLVDDSVVRSTTISYIVDLLKYNEEKGWGAKEVHVRITYPPILAPCLHGGLAFPTRKELAYTKFGSIEGIKRAINADSLAFTDPKDLREAIGLDDICDACATGNYPLKEKINLEEIESAIEGFVSG